MVAFADVVRTTEFPADKFFSVEDVPVFVEHEARLSDGRTISFDRARLERIAANCNRRIAETGDYAVVTLGHTPTPNEPGKPMPEVVGFAGPFRVGEYGGKAAVLADMHIFIERKEELRRWPRRSPEFRLTGPDDIYLDPIALLGAEPPRLDMGLTMLYSERSEGAPVERYAFAMPSGGNVFVPGVIGDQRREKYQMTDEQLKLIIEAIEKLDWVQWIKKKIAEEQTGGGSANKPSAAEPPASAGGDAKPADEDRERYRRLEQSLQLRTAEIETLRKQIEDERADRINAERYSQLMALRNVYAFDLDKEADRCRYSKMSDEQFRDHLTLVRENYRRIPVGERLPPLGRAVDQEEPTERYSAEVRAKAREEAIRRRNSGQDVDFSALLEELSRK